MDLVKHFVTFPRETNKARFPLITALMSSILFKQLQEDHVRKVLKIAGTYRIFSYMIAHLNGAVLEDIKKKNNKKKENIKLW